jgi:BASS family bile acid:Na+ symporter
MKEALQVIDGIRLNISTESGFIVNLTLAFIMFGVALGIKFKHFKEVFFAPKLPLIGFLSQFLVLPIVTFLLVLAMNSFITPTVALGMILVASCPGGNISNFMTAMAKGNAALSVMLTAIATLGAVFLTPFNFALWGGYYSEIVSRQESQQLLQPISIEFFDMFKVVFILLGIPLITGMLFNQFFPKATRVIFKPIRFISIFLFLMMVVILLKNNFIHVLNHLKYIFIIVLIHNILALLSGNMFAYAWKIGGANRRAITIETGIQNSMLALVLLVNPKIFPEDLQIGGMVFIAAWWGVWHIISGLSLATFWSRREPKN